MKKTNYTCILILSLLLSLYPLRLSAVIYGNSYAPAYSGYEETVYMNPPMAEAAPSGDYPAYVPAASGDLDPFGASSHQANRGGSKRAPGKTEGDKEGPAFPIADGTWFLILLLGGYAAWIMYQRKKELR